MRTKLQKSKERVMTELHLYMVCYPHGYEEIHCVEVDEVRGLGRVAAFESHLREATTWFYPIGKVEAYSDGHRGPRYARERVAALVKTWEERGSPKLDGGVRHTEVRMANSPHFRLPR